MPINTEDFPILEDKDLKIEKEIYLECINDKSSKGYKMRLELSKNDDRAQIFSSWGKLGNNWIEEWRHYTSHEKATKEYETIVKSKKKKGYVEV